MPVIAYFIIAFSVFLVLLAITWSFRNTAAKLARRAARRVQWHGCAPTTRTTPTGTATEHAPRGHGRDLRPDPPWPPRRRQ